jgi:Glycosyltransferase
MALGKAILSTKVGVVGENLIAEEEALFVEPGDAVGLAAAIQRLVRDPKLLRKLATNAAMPMTNILVSSVLERDSSRCWRKRLSLAIHGVKE